jgi:hypothetical protein
MGPPPKLSRRTLTFAGVAAVGAAVIAGATYEIPRLFKRHASGEYADLVNRLDDPDAAAMVGKNVEADNLHEAAGDIRAQLKKRALSALLADDAAAGKLTEADGWVLPSTLASICAMAALAS